ncbi:Peptidase family M50 [Fragilaria crotonensis]|nr:Peptidase family M50 [Fragilaria crotonensis]
MGATVAMKRRPEDAWEDALVGLGGPILGSIGALGCSLGARAMDSQLLYALADFGYFINLLNLLPIGMMDPTEVRPSDCLKPRYGLTLPFDLAYLAPSLHLNYTQDIKNLTSLPCLILQLGKLHLNFADPSNRIVY